MGGRGRMREKGVGKETKTKQSPFPYSLPPSLSATRPGSEEYVDGGRGC